VLKRMTRRRGRRSSASPPLPFPVHWLMIAYLASALRGQPRVIASSCVVIISPTELTIHSAEPASAWHHITTSGLSWSWYRGIPWLTLSHWHVEFSTRLAPERVESVVLLNPNCSVLNEWHDSSLLWLNAACFSVMSNKVFADCGVLQ